MLTQTEKNSIIFQIISHFAGRFTWTKKQGVWEGVDEGWSITIDEEGIHLYSSLQEVYRGVYIEDYIDHIVSIEKRLSKAD